jgi:hypothetical protein
MTASRWALVVAVTAAAGIAVWLGTGRDLDKPVPAATAALPLPWPTPGSAPASFPGPAEPAARAWVPPPSAAVPAPSAVGSEGYGPQVERVLAGSDASQAWDAATLLRQCASSEQRRASFEKARNEGAPATLMTQLMQEEDAHARRCQTVTARHQAMLPELISRALRSGSPAALSALSNPALLADLTPAQRAELAQALRRDAQAGDRQSLLGTAMSHESWGLGTAERLGFLYAYDELSRGQAGRVEVATLIDQYARQLTPDQQAAARLAAQQIVARAGASRPP